MIKKVKNFYDFVVEGILVNNHLGITEVRNIEDLRSMNFQRQEYMKIVELIKSANIEAIKSYPENLERTLEYITILKFMDQNEKKFIVTVYDSDELWQDPQIIDVFTIEPS